METVYKSARYRKLGEQVIKDNEDLHWIKECRLRISYVESDKQKVSNGKIVYADCNKVQPLYKAYIPYDFIIRMYEPNVMMLNDDQIKILMYHELLHVGLEDNGETRIVPHDIEDFGVILSRYGMNWNLPEGGGPYGT